MRLDPEVDLGEPGELLSVPPMSSIYRKPGGMQAFCYGSGDYLCSIILMTMRDDARLARCVLWYDPRATGG